MHSLNGFMLLAVLSIGFIDTGKYLILLLLLPSFYLVQPITVLYLYFLDYKYLLLLTSYKLGISRHYSR